MMLAEPIPGLAVLPYVPAERLEPRWVDLHNRLHRRRQLPPLRYRGEDLRVQWPGVALPIEQPLTLSLTLDGEPLRLSLPGALLASPHGVPSGLARALLAEQALLALIEPLERTLGCTLRVVDVAPDGEWPLPLSLWLGVALGDAPAAALELRLGAAAARRLVEALERDCPVAPRPFDALRLTARVQPGWQWLTLGELRSLAPGDVVMLEHPGEGALRLSIQDQLQARCRRQADGLRLEHFPQPSVETPMNNEAAALGVDASLDDLQLQLVCQLGSSQLSLAELRELGEGSVLPLAAREPDAVDLTVNGCRVGRGQLVRIGEGLGVRIISLARP
ncbi:YscQ/HrcQ family type III secretion apparatus protein [Stutzerimonas nosocomialis]|uniref:type III secretion system cytoplasmic ring protein SctQ n=1 Tax=Stutzerimonas nosocomialis TaxID=1056496 RepID=UPI0011082375|nr:type III secretion system cytoplasmic ring protein SctQ [Stutzerimonas nosocomialis]TLX56889.1 YscQ/HrcQ family type III secretion apparatus protein [Stutzerimonas nosocomialis]